MQNNLQLHYDAIAFLYLWHARNRMSKCNSTRELLNTCLENLSFNMVRKWLPYEIFITIIQFEVDVKDRDKWFWNE